MLFPEPVSPIMTTTGFLSTVSMIVSSNLRIGSVDSIDGKRRERLVYQRKQKILE